VERRVLRYVKTEPTGPGQERKETRMKISTGRICAALLFALGVAGCGSDSRGTTLETGVSGDKPLNTLSQDEATKVCKSVGDWSKRAFSEEKLKEIPCKLTAALFGALAGDAEQARMACTQTYNSCLQQPAMPSQQESTCGMVDSNCTATVAEMEACLNELPKAFDDFAAALPSCDALGSGMMSMPFNLESLNPPACKTFESKCPGGLSRSGAPSVSLSAAP
jgi:hypothetical protein